jgi:diacylglycerol kinase family enzyme
MRVLVLYNPISGAGRAVGAAEELCEHLGGVGHDPVLAPTRLEPSEAWLDLLLAGEGNGQELEALVVVGGDGAVRLASGAAARTGTPLYHFPSGTENLFAREFGFDRTYDHVLGALERGEVRRVDAGTANGKLFLLMASIGFDAEVVHDLASRRKGGISHATYVAPILRQLLRYDPPRLTIVVDGEPFVEGEAGFVVVGNSRQYGQRFDPARRASMVDGCLDVVFFPAPNRRRLLGWAVACRRGRHLDRPGLRYRLGREIAVSSEAPGPFQLDGDAPAEDGVTASVKIAVIPQWLPVLLP